MTTTATAAASTGNDTSGRMDSYLALVPRGLDHVVLKAMEEAFAPHHFESILLGEQEPDIARLTTMVKQANEKKKKKLPKCKMCLKSTGTVNDTQQGRHHMSMGYYRESDDNTTSRVVLSWPGQLEGVVWIQFQTDAPVSKVANFRCVGPLLALVESFENIQLTESQSLEEAVASIQRGVLDRKSYSLEPALKVWHDHAQQTWPLSQQERDDISQSIQDKSKQLTFRLSCIRHQSKKYPYTREDLVRSVADTVMCKNRNWRVDLNHYQVEVVLLIRASCMAIGLSLRNYLQLGAKSFAAGAVPPDVARPYLSGSLLSGLVRLRPSTAQLLLRMARLEPGDVLLDPCAGIGTIPMEHGVGLGGDLGLGEGHGTWANVATQYAKEMRKERQSCGELCAWDAATLPLRSSCVDAIVSDLPFGQQCMSNAKLDGFLPLLLGQCGRVLRPSTGRMVLLCGSHVSVLEALEQINEISNNVWELPCQSMFPVNIGGFSAWVLQVRRGRGEVVLVDNHLDRVKKMAAKRDRIARQRARDEIEPSKQGRSKYRRTQS